MSSLKLAKPHRRLSMNRMHRARKSDNMRYIHQ
jgi:hypothetical protein